MSSLILDAQSGKKFQYFSSFFYKEITCKLKKEWYVL